MKKNPNKLLEAHNNRSKEGLESQSLLCFTSMKRIKRLKLLTLKTIK